MRDLTLTTRTLAIEWASDGVRVNAVSPGTIYSPTAAANYQVDVFEMAAHDIPAKRTGTVEEVRDCPYYSTTLRLPVESLGSQQNLVGTGSGTCA